MLKFYILSRRLGLASPPHFVYDFWRKMLFMLYSINWPNSVAWLPLLLEILGNMCIVIICYPVCGVINFEINLSFLITPFLYITKKAGQKRKYLKNERSFQHEIKIIFHHFKGLYWSPCYQAVFVHGLKSQDKNLNILITKRAFNLNKQHVSSFLKTFH